MNNARSKKEREMPLFASLAAPRKDEQSDKVRFVKIFNYDSNELDQNFIFLHQPRNSRGPELNLTVMYKAMTLMSCIILLPSFFEHSVLCIAYL